MHQILCEDAPRPCADDHVTKSGKSLEALPGVAYPGFRDNRSTLNTKTGYKKMHPKVLLCKMPFLPQPYVFPGSGIRSEYAGLDTLKQK